MSQESVSLSAGTVQQSYTGQVEHVPVDSDDHQGSSHTVEMMGIGLAAGILLGGIVGVVTNSLGLAVMFGAFFGVVLGLYLMERF